MEEILNQSIDTLLDKPFYSFSATMRPRGWVNNLLLKWGFRKPITKTYELQSLTGGNAYRVTSKLLTIPEAAIQQGSDAILRDMFKLHTAHISTVAYIVAVSITNSRQEPPESLIDELMWNVSEAQLREAARMVVKNFDVANFTNTIVSIVGMDLISPAKETSPTVPGVLSEGS